MALRARRETAKRLRQFGRGVTSGVPPNELSPAFIPLFASISRTFTPVKAPSTHAFPTPSYIPTDSIAPHHLQFDGLDVSHVSQTLKAPSPSLSPSSVSRFSHSGIGPVGSFPALHCHVAAAAPYTLAGSAVRFMHSSASSSAGVVGATGGVAAVPTAGRDDVMHHILSDALKAIRAAGTYKEERIITSPQGPAVSVSEAGAPVLNFCANNYLGLSNHPRLLKAAGNALATHGFGLASVRFICGTQDLHKELERQLSAFHGTEDTILYPSCFDANAGLFEALLTSDDAVISDELNHASIIDGIRLCRAERHRFRHLDMADLERKLVETQDRRIRLVATDGVFSMDGHVAPLADICQLARAHGAYVFVDECHATGFFGPTGRGTDEFCGVSGQVDIINSTLGKALGGATGGYTTGRKDVVDILRQRARPYLFSNTLAPSVAAAGIEVMKMLMESTDLRDRLAANTAYFREQMTRAGFDIRPGQHPIVPIMLGDARLAHDMAQKMLARGIYVVGFSYPVVPKGAARIRVQLSAAHTREHLDTALQAFAHVGKELGVI